MQKSKYKQFKFSKYKYPTTIVAGSGSGKGQLFPGKSKAAEVLKSMVGAARFNQMKEIHTRYQWRWGELKNKKAV